MEEWTDERKEERTTREHNASAGHSGLAEAFELNMKTMNPRIENRSIAEKQLNE